ncbi:alpha/beta-hydrolase [Trichoderma novae-zelandiae]
MSSVATSARDQALSYISDPRFTQKFSLPERESQDAITVSFADVGFKPVGPTASRSTPTVLFIPGMFGSRYIGAVLDPVARKYGVRVLVIDRPGMGLSTDVPLSQRIPTWIRIVPLLLAHLDIPHVALVAHSAGMLYLLNTLHHYRDLLHPERPVVAFMAPWVDPAHSKVTSMQMLQYLPTQAFSIWHRIPRFFVVDAAPVLATSGTVLNKATSLFSASSGTNNVQELTTLERNKQKLADEYNFPRDFQMELGTVLTKKIFDENTVGANGEALQCLRKGKGWSWGECDDYAVLMESLVSTERQRRQLNPNWQDDMRLKVRAYFAESDIMIGAGGQKYIEEIWGWKDNAFGDVLDFDSVTVPATDHDSVMQPIENLEQLFVDAGGSLVR